MHESTGRRFLFSKKLYCIYKVSKDAKMLYKTKLSVFVYWKNTSIKLSDFSKAGMLYVSFFLLKLENSTYHSKLYCRI